MEDPMMPLLVNPLATVSAPTFPRPNARRATGRAAPDP